MFVELCIHFSATYRVQSATFALVNSSVNVTCIFAINASASACWVVFINSSLGLNFSGTVNHSLPESTGLIDIPGSILNKELEQLGCVVFNAKVYVMNMDGTVTYDIAYELQEALVVCSMRPNANISGSTAGIYRMYCIICFVVVCSVCHPFHILLNFIHV